MTYYLSVSTNNPRKGFLGEWDKLTPKMRVAAVVLLILPVFMYPPSVFLYMGYAVYLYIRDRNK